MNQPFPEFAGDFPILRKMDFFNHAGVGPISGPAAKAIRDYAQQAETAAYVGADWYRRANQTKKLAAQLINAHGGHEIAFVPNTSTGLSLVAKGLTFHAGDRVVITNVEYPANRYPWEDLKRQGVELFEVPQSDDGRIDVERVCDAINDRTRVVSMSHVQYASGFRIDLKPISDMVHRAGGYLCVDAIQSCGVVPVDVAAMGIDFLSADGHKWMLAPEGAGIFYCREDLCPLLHPNVVGWMNMVDAGNYGDYQFKFQMDARRFEPGSWNIPGIAALGASLELLRGVGIDGPQGVWSRVEALTTRLCEALQAKGYPVFTPRASPGERSGIVIFDLPASRRDSLDPKQLVADLQKQGIIIVVREGRLRASPHFYNTAAQIDHLVEALPVG